MQTETNNLLQAPTPAALRDELERLVLLDLLGPAAGPAEEVNEASVQDRYPVGMLAPCHKQIMPEELDELALAADGNGNEDGTNEQSALNTVTLSPSSVGMSFCVTPNATALCASRVYWARYKGIIRRSATCWYLSGIDP